MFSLGGELKKMFLEHGNFEQMELAIKHKHTRENSKKKSGGWFTKHKLEHTESYSKTHVSKCYRRPLNPEVYPKVSPKFWRTPPFTLIKVHDREGVGLSQVQEPCADQ